VVHKIEEYAANCVLSISCDTQFQLFTELHVSLVISRLSLLLTEETPGSGGNEVGSNSNVADSKPFRPSLCYNNKSSVSWRSKVTRSFDSPSLLHLLPSVQQRCHTCVIHTLWHVTCHVTTHRSSLGDRAFMIAGPRAWNSLPEFVSDCSSHHFSPSKNISRLTYLLM